MKSFRSMQNSNSLVFMGLTWLWVCWSSISVVSISLTYTETALLMCVDMGLRINAALIRAKNLPSGNSSEGMVTRSGKKKHL